MPIRRTVGAATPDPHTLTLCPPHARYLRLVRTLLYSPARLLMNENDLAFFLYPQIPEDGNMKRENENLRCIIYFYLDPPLLHPCWHPIYIVFRISAFSSMR